MGICVSCRRRDRKPPEKRSGVGLGAGGPAKSPAAAELLPRRVDHLPAMANSISNIKMTNPIKGIVSRRRKRYMKDGFNLDLAYITDRLIAMGFPAEKLEGVYRNHIDEVYRFLEQKHKDHYKIYNLCSERSYDISRFQGRVERYAFDDHTPPNMELIQPFCEDVHKWLGEDSRNVAAVHCKAGKGRTGTMVCCYLLYSGQKATADEALQFYGTKRTHDEKGVTIPSQRRYVEYYAALVRSGLQYAHTAVYVRELVMCPPPALNGGQCTLELTVSQAQPPFKAPPGCHEVRKHARAVRVCLTHCTPLTGDVRVDVYNKPKMMMRKEKLFHFWFNTFFLVCEVGAQRVPSPADSPNQETFKLTLNKWQLDDAHKDKQHKLYSPDFKVELIVQKQPDSSTFSARPARPPSPPSSSASDCSDAPPAADEHWDSGELPRVTRCALGPRCVQGPHCVPGPYCVPGPDCVQGPQSVPGPYCAPGPHCVQGPHEHGTATVAVGCVAKNHAASNHELGDNVAGNHQERAACAQLNTTSPSCERHLLSTQEFSDTAQPNCNRRPEAMSRCNHCETTLQSCHIHSAKDTQPSEVKRTKPKYKSSKYTMFDNPSSQQNCSAADSDDPSTQCSYKQDCKLRLVDNQTHKELVYKVTDPIIMSSTYKHDIKSNPVTCNKQNCNVGRGNHASTETDCQLSDLASAQNSRTQSPNDLKMDMDRAQSPNQEPTEMITEPSYKKTDVNPEFFQGNVFADNHTFRSTIFQTDLTLDQNYIRLDDYEDRDYSDDHMFFDFSGNRSTKSTEPKPELTEPSLNKNKPHKLKYTTDPSFKHSKSPKSKLDKLYRTYPEPIDPLIINDSKLDSKKNDDPKHKSDRQSKPECPPDMFLKADKTFSPNFKTDSKNYIKFTCMPPNNALTQCNFKPGDPYSLLPVVENKDQAYSLNQEFSKPEFDENQSISRTLNEPCCKSDKPAIKNYSLLPPTEQPDNRTLSKPRLSLTDVKASWREFSGKFSDNRKKRDKD